MYKRQVIAFSLLAINRQQQDLALRNSLSLEPVRADVEAISRGPNPVGSDEGIAALRPLEQVQKRTPQQWLDLVRGALPQSQGCWRLLWLSQESCSSPVVGEIGFNSQRAPAR